MFWTSSSLDSSQHRNADSLVQETPTALSSAAKRPETNRPSILWSLIQDQKGWLNVAGLLCSIAKWPSQARPYPITGATRSINQRSVTSA